MKQRFTNVFISTAILALNTMVLFSQVGTTKNRTFDVVSVKMNKSGGNDMTLGGRGNRFVATNATVRQLAQFAYHPSDTRLQQVQVQILGGPGWVDTSRFDIEAITDERLTNFRSEMARMVQSLLEDRFLLRVHIETKDAPAYDLVVGKNGPRLQFSTDQTPPEPQASSGVLSQNSVGGAGRGPAIAAGPVPRGVLRLQDGELTASAVTLAALSRFLARQLDGSVTDKTGITGLVDIKLQFQPNLQPASVPFERVRSGLAIDNASLVRLSGASISTVIQKLGLELVPFKRAIDVFIIDSVQYPSEN
jgi:uncharacterized protein (TIGR03435 family)